MAARITDEAARAVMIAAGFEPLEPYSGNNVPWRCRCAVCQREVTPRYSSICAGKRCAYCTGERVDAKFAVKRMVAAGLEPLEPYPGTKQRWRCRCNGCEREVWPRYGSVLSGQGGCVHCGKRGVDPAEAVEVMRAAGLEPLEPYPGQNSAPWLCRCNVCGEETKPRLTNVRARGNMCATCWRERRHLVHRLDESDAIAVMVAAGFEPLDPYPGAGAPWRCKCITCNREIAPSYTKVRYGGGCAYCAGTRVDEADAITAMVNAGLQPLEPYPGADSPWRCKCVTCNRDVTPSYSSIRYGGGCRFCSTGGLDYTAPGIVYVMHHPDLFCLKVGVSTAAAKKVRVDTHAKTGWVTIRTWDTPTGETAEQIEQQILGWWRKELGAPVALTTAEMPSGGWSETAALIHVDIDDTINRISRLVAELEP